LQEGGTFSSIVTWRDDLHSLQWINGSGRLTGDIGDASVRSDGKIQPIHHWSCVPSLVGGYSLGEGICFIGMSSWSGTEGESTCEQRDSGLADGSDSGKF